MFSKFISAICCVAILFNCAFQGPIFASDHPLLEPKDQPAPPLPGWSYKEGELEDFDYAAFIEDGTEKELTSLISQEQTLYPLITVYRDQFETFCVPVCEEQFDMTQEIVFEEEDILVFETKLLGIPVAYVTFDYDYSTDTISMHIADLAGAPVTAGEFRVAIADMENGCLPLNGTKRWKLPKKHIGKAVAFITGVVVAWIGKPPTPSPGTQSTSAPNGDVINFAAFPDGSTTTQIIRADGSIKIIKYDPNGDPKVKTTEIPPPKKPNQQKP